MEEVESDFLQALKAFCNCIFSWKAAYFYKKMWAHNSVSFFVIYVDCWIMPCFFYFNLIVRKAVDDILAKFKNLNLIKYSFAAFNCYVFCGILSFVGEYAVIIIRRFGYFPFWKYKKFCAIISRLSSVLKSWRREKENGQKYMNAQVVVHRTTIFNRF
jgi:hypothetical protein